MFSISSSSAESVFMIDTARHALSSNAVDVVVAEGSLSPPFSCYIFGYASHGDGTFAFNYTIPQCETALLFASERYVANGLIAGLRSDNE